MRITRDTGERLELCGPPGGFGTVALVLVVGTAMTAGAAAFLPFMLRSGQTVGAGMVGVVGTAGLAILIFGIALALTRDRLELDAVTGRGAWSRRTLGRHVKPPFEFEFVRAKAVVLQRFADGGGSSGAPTVDKIRARLRISKPRRTVDLIEAERGGEDRVRAVAERVAEMLSIDVNGPQG